MDSDKSCDSLHVVRLDDVEVTKTAAVYNTANSMWQVEGTSSAQGSRDAICDEGRV